MKIIRAGCPDGNTSFSRDLKNQSPLDKHKKVSAVALYKNHLHYISSDINKYIEKGTA
ncbi:MAG: hypothetical protein IJY19_11085 [Ruminococcus sp.]|nr:hypothetical protein [Ruminococcus sp.]